MKVLLTRSAEDNARWARALAAAGHEAVSLDCLRCESLPESSAALAAELPRSGWLAFGSRRAVEGFAELAPRQVGSKGPLPERVRVACVGETTAARARELLGRCDLVAPDGTARSLGAALAPLAAAEGARVLLPGAESPREEATEALRAAGVDFARVAVYRTTPAPPRAPRLEPAVDVVLLASPSAVRGLTNQARLPDGARVVCLGPSTRAAAESAGLRVDAEAKARDLDGMLAALNAAASPDPER